VAQNDLTTKNWMLGIPNKVVVEPANLKKSMLFKMVYR